MKIGCQKQVVAIPDKTNFHIVVSSASRVNIKKKKKRPHERFLFYIKY